MLSDLIAVQYYFFLILEIPCETPIGTYQPREEPVNDLEPESEAGVTLPCSTPHPPPTLRCRFSTPETIDHLSPLIHRLDQISESYQEFIDSLEQN